MMEQVENRAPGIPQAPGSARAAAGFEVGGPAALRRKRVIAIAVLVVMGALLGIACWRYVPGAVAWLMDARAVRAFVDQWGVLSRLAMIGINMIQVVLAFLPGEPIELASGYAFGFWEGTALCLVASALATSLVYWAVHRWGWRVAGLFFDRSMLDRFSWLRDERRLELVMFIVFLIPGTPKDFLTYFAGLTRARFLPVLLITTVGRIPSIVTSTVAASSFDSGNYLVTGISLAVAVVLALAGVLVSVKRRHPVLTRQSAGRGNSSGPSTQK